LGRPLITSQLNNFNNAFARDCNIKISFSFEIHQFINNNLMYRYKFNNNNSLKKIAIVMLINYLDLKKVVGWFNLN